MPSNSMEDYLERIYRLIRSKGYARSVDIAEWLGVQQPSVTKMIQRLDEAGYVRYERYRGLMLTPKGEALARAVVRRHETIARFLRVLGIPEETIAKDVDGIEHHISDKTLDCINRLTELLESKPDLTDELDA